MDSLGKRLAQLLGNVPGRWPAGTLRGEPYASDADIIALFGEAGGAGAIFDVLYFQAGAADPTVVAGAKIDVYDVLNAISYSFVRGDVGVYNLDITFSSLDAVVGDFRVELENNSDVAIILRSSVAWNNTTKVLSVVVNSMNAAGAAAEIGGNFAVKIRQL